MHIHTWSVLIYAYVHNNTSSENLLLLFSNFPLEKILFNI